MKKIKILLFTLFYVSVGNAQQVFSLDDDQNYIDSLQTIIDKSPSDSTIAILHLKLSNLYRRNKQLERSQNHLTEAKKHIKQNAFLKDYLSYFDGLQFLNNGDYQGFDKALIKADDGLKKYKNKEAFRLRALILSNHAIMQQVFGREAEAVKIIIHHAIPLAVKSNDNELVGNLYKSLGIIFMNYPERKKAYNYLSEAIAYLKKADKGSPTFKENFIEALVVHSENLLELENYTLANSCLNTAYSILKTHPNSNLNSIYCYAKGLYFHKTKQYHKAIPIYQKGIENTVIHNGQFTKFRLQFALHQTYMALKEYGKSKELLLSLLTNNTYLKGDQKNYLKDLAFVSEQLGDINQSNQYYKSYITLNDSLNNATHKEEIIELEAKFNKSQNEHKIKQLQSQKVKAELLARNNRLQYLIIVLAAGVLLTMLIFVLYHLRIKNKLEIERNLKNKQTINWLKNQKEVEVMQAMIDGEELERKRIARELHDGIGSKLSALKIMLARLELKTAPGEIEGINELLSNSINELRQVSYNLIPESLTKLGLEKALSDLCHLLHSDSIKIEFQSFGIDDDIPISSQINIYRIVQELLNNALKHSECTEILVSCSQNGDAFLISVEDNGKGFDVEDSSRKSGIGLKNLKSRVEMLHGTYNIESNNEGTCYDIELNIATR
ncbi:sensor histidine kinase [Flavobacterium sp.]